MLQAPSAVIKINCQICNSFRCGRVISKGMSFTLKNRDRDRELFRKPDRGAGVYHLILFSVGHGDSVFSGRGRGKEPEKIRGLQIMIKRSCDHHRFTQLRSGDEIAFFLKLRLHPKLFLRDGAVSVDRKQFRHIDCGAPEKGFSAMVFSCAQIKSCNICSEA